MDLTKPYLPAFQAYTDKFGMVQLDGQSVSDNGNLWTAFYVLGLVKNGVLVQDERVRLSIVLLNNFKQLGLLTRYPGSPDFEAQDDHCGIMMADALMDPDRNFSNELYNYGDDPSHCVKVDPREPVPATLLQDKILYYVLKILFLGKVKWNYNPVSPNSLSIYSWFGRRMELIAAIQMSARQSVNPIYWLYWAIIMLTTSDSVGYMLHYCNAVSCKGYGRLTDLVCNLFIKKMVKKYDNVGNMFGQSNGHMDHPLVSLLSNVKGN